MNWSRIAFVILLLLTFLAGCECEFGGLNRTCPVEEQLNKDCFVREDGTWTEINPKSILWNVSDNSRCQRGFTKCDSRTLQVYCDGFVWSTEEQCGNQIDDDCDFEVDEGFDEDQDGFKTCQGDCQDDNPEIYPGRSELCNNEDDNCDGLTDNLEPISCWTGPDSALVNTQEVPCETGLSYCEDGEWSPCRDQVLPVLERCDWIDNDCDGLADNNPITDGISCGPTDQTGICQYGSQLCIGGESICVDAQMPMSEACNGADDDCDGLTDEDLWQSCSTVCGSGVEFCQAGDWIGCTAQQPTEEVCDGLDNNCDGKIDEGCTCITGTAQTCYQDMVDAEGDPINCGIGFQFCLDGNWDQCEFYASLPEQCNNWDDDCDQIVDQQQVACGDEQYAGIGTCTLGQTQCVEGEWTACEGAVDPQEETCNGLDEDCNGLIDDGLDPDEKVDMVFVVDNSGSMCGKIHALRGGITSYVNGFQDSDHLFGLVIFPTWEQDIVVLTMPALTDVNSFLTALTAMTCAGPGVEPSYDALHQVTDPSDPLSVGWREDATPYVVLVTDENGQGAASESQIATHTNNCQIGNCEPGDQIEIFIISTPNSVSNFDAIAFFDPERLINIYPAEQHRYTQILKGIFANICIYESTDAGP